MKKPAPMKNGNHKAPVGSPEYLKRSEFDAVKEHALNQRQRRKRERQVGR